MRTSATADPGCTTARRQRRRTAFLFAVLGLFVTLALVWAGAHLFTGHSLWAGAIAWGDSDIGDVRHAPTSAPRRRSTVVERWSNTAGRAVP